MPGRCPRWTTSRRSRWTSGRSSRAIRASSRAWPECELNDHLAPQRSLRARFDDFKQALERRDRAAYQLALRDFQEALRRWTEIEERVMLAALARTAIPGRDPQRELRLEYVQVRELTRYLREQVSINAPIGDVLGLVENLDRRLSAHEAEMERVYYPAALGVLTDSERRTLREAAPLL